jgi:hypothetical protein
MQSDLLSIASGTDSGLKMKQPYMTVDFHRSSQYLSNNKGLAVFARPAGRMHHLPSSVLSVFTLVATGQSIFYESTEKRVQEK